MKLLDFVDGLGITRDIALFVDDLFQYNLDKEDVYILCEMIKLGLPGFEKCSVRDHSDLPPGSYSSELLGINIKTDTIDNSVSLNQSHFKRRLSYYDDDNDEVKKIKKLITDNMDILNRYRKLKAFL